MKQGGAVANSNGRVLENIVESSLNTKGFTSTNYKDWQKDPLQYSDELLLKNVPYLNVYNHASKTEFVIKSKHYHLNTRIECKWQQASGSVDEKYPFLFLNCAERMNEPQIIILLDGGGAKPGAIDWLKDACQNFNQQEKGRSDRRIELMNSTEFLQWVNKTLK
jgi:hypothetical protein